MISLSEPGAPTPAVVYGGDPVTAPAPVAPLELVATTEPLRIVVGAGLEIYRRGIFESQGFLQSARAIPTSISLRAGSARSSMGQLYQGRARFELICEPLRGLGREIPPSEMDVGATVELGASARLHPWTSGFTTCPTLRQQFEFAESPAVAEGSGSPIWRTWSIRLDTAELLDADTLTVNTFEAGVSNLHYEIVVTATPAP